MTTDEFLVVQNKMISHCLNTLGQKAGEYATDDRLHNFKKAAGLLDQNAVQALAGMMTKHTISVYDMLCSGKSYPPEVWDEKIGDLINYLILARAVVIDIGLVGDTGTAVKDDRSFSGLKVQCVVKDDSDDRASTTAQYLPAFGTIGTIVKASKIPGEEGVLNYIYQIQWPIGSTGDMESDLTWAEEWQIKFLEDK